MTISVTVGLASLPELGCFVKIAYHFWTVHYHAKAEAFVVLGLLKPRITIGFFVATTEASSKIWTTRNFVFVQTDMPVLYVKTSER
jgi:hypothetical protein